MRIVVLCIVGSLVMPVSVQPATCERYGESCLHLVYAGDEPSPAIVKFDTAFDRNLHGESFSCDVVYSASSVRRVVESFRRGVLYDDQAAIFASVRFPLKVNSIESGFSGKYVANIDEWREFSAKYLTGLRYALISCASARTVKIYRDRGCAIGPGFVWLTGPDDQSIKVTTINLDELSSLNLEKYCGSSSSPEEGSAPPNSCVQRRLTRSEGE